MLRALTLSAPDGQPLAVTCFTPPNPRAVVVIGPAMAVCQWYYRPFASYLAQGGVAAITFDYRGFGGSYLPPHRQKSATPSTWGEQDLAAVLEWAAGTWPALPLHYVGHSMGGQILGLAAGCDRVDRFCGIAAQSCYWRNWPGLSQWVMGLASFLLFPTCARLLGRIPGWLGLGEELPGPAAREWAAWCRKPGYVLPHPTADRPRAYRRFTGALIAHGFADDTYAPPAAVAGLLALYPAARRRERRRVSVAAAGAPVGHFGFFRPRFRATLWDPVAELLGASPVSQSASRPIPAPSLPR